MLSDPTPVERRFNDVGGPRASSETSSTQFASHSPAPLVFSKRTSEFRVTRIQLNVVARRERQLLTWLCGRLPLSVTPDHLTALSVVGAVVVLASYVGTRQSPAFLWLASLGFVLNWFGDSLDGSLARYRGIERPSYGYFLDHTIDALNNLLMMIGLGATPFVRMDVALFALVGYYLLCIYVFINNHLSGVFQLSFLGCGPTELRLCLVAINTAVFFYGAGGWWLNGEFVSVCDLILIGAGLAFIGLFVTRVAAGIRALRNPMALRADAQKR